MHVYTTCSRGGSGLFRRRGVPVRGNRHSAMSEDQTSWDSAERFRFRFHLRSLFIVETVFCCFLATALLRAWSVAVVTWITCVVVGLGILVLLQLPLFLLFWMLGILPGRRVPLPARPAEPGRNVTRD